MFNFKYAGKLILRPANIDVSVKRLRNFCLNKMEISREDRMLINCFTSRKRLRFKEVIS